MKNSVLSRTIAFALAAILLLGCIAVPVFAAEDGVVIKLHYNRPDGNYADCHEYRIAELEQLSEDLLRMFRITPVLVQRWRSAGVTFRLCIFTREGTLMGGRIDKRRSLPGDFPSVSYLTTPTQQEIRITGRILRYLVEKSTFQ